jgi:hypothetical protein
MLQRSGHFSEGTPGVTIERACTVQDLRSAYELVHEVFVERGYCTATDHGIRLRFFEATAAMATFVAKFQGRVVGVLSVVGEDPEQGLPSDKAFRPELDKLRRSCPGATLCEWSNQVVAKDLRKTNVPTALMRCAAAHVIKAGYSHSIISVSAVHEGFYDLLGFKQVGSVRSYSAHIHDPVVALCLPSSLYLGPNPNENELANFVRQFMATDNPFLAQMDSWDAEFRHFFCDPVTLRRLFVEKSNFLRTCEFESQTALMQRWGAQTFRQVMESTVVESILAWTRTTCEILRSKAKLTRRSGATLQRIGKARTAP